MARLFLSLTVGACALLLAVASVKSTHHHRPGYGYGPGTLGMGGVGMPGMGISIEREQGDSSYYGGSSMMTSGGMPMMGMGPYGGMMGGPVVSGQSQTYRDNEFSRESVDVNLGRGFRQFKRSTGTSLSAEADKVLQAGSRLDTKNIPAVVEFVEKHKVGECLARVICELAANSNSHGDAGAKLANHLLKFRHVNHEKIGYYLQAGNDGVKSKKIEICARTYNCPSRSDEVIEVTNKILRL